MTIIKGVFVKTYKQSIYKLQYKKLCYLNLAVEHSNFDIDQWHAIKWLKTYHIFYRCKTKRQYMG